MAITTHEKIRTESGFQSFFVREPFQNSPNGTQNTFYVNSDDNVKFVPNFGTGATVAGVSDVQVFLGLSGVYGASMIGVSALDIDQGNVQLVIAPPAGASLTISYASSAIPGYQIEEVRKHAESMVNQRLSICYSLPLSPIPSSIVSMTTRLASALLLIRGYGAGSVDTATDGYKLYELIVGSREALISQGSESEVSVVGELGAICTANYQLVDDDGNIIPKDSEGVDGNADYKVGGRVVGRLYDITEEEFRFKDWQSEANTNQPGSNL